MISAVSKAGSSYVGPSEYLVRNRLLDDDFAAVKARNDARISNHSMARRLMTIVSDACTINKKPLTNYVAKYTNEPGILLKYEDATEFYQDNEEKIAT
jgi:uncharacterized ubiquitin-like protein YukD